MLLDASVSAKHAIRNREVTNHGQSYIFDSCLCCFRTIQTINHTMPYHVNAKWLPVVCPYHVSTDRLRLFSCMRELLRIHACVFEDDVEEGVEGLERSLVF